MASSLWPFVMGIAIGGGVILIKTAIINSKYPLHQIILKEVGKTMPKPIITRVRKQGSWFVGQNGVVTPAEFVNLIGELIYDMHWLIASKKLFSRQGEGKAFNWDDL